MLRWKYKNDIKIGARFTLFLSEVSDKDLGQA